MSPASSGVDFEAAAAQGIRVIHALSLPGKTVPETAGEIVAQTVLEILAEREGGAAND
ncbi:MAG: hypothetical protein IK107_03405 [Oscillospiraceae bacterium]|nr:hypothetical protein [Oscillospiraceae bacterium]